MVALGTLVPGLEHLSALGALDLQGHANLPVLWLLVEKVVFQNKIV